MTLTMAGQELRCAHTKSIIKATFLERKIAKRSSLAQIDFDDALAVPPSNEQKRPHL